WPRGMDRRLDESVRPGERAAEANRRQLRSRRRAAVGKRAALHSWHADLRRDELRTLQKDAAGLDQALRREQCRPGRSASRRPLLFQGAAARRDLEVTREDASS